MRSVREVIVVEGRYDKIAVAQAVSATIIETSGFGVFSNKDKVKLIRKLSEKCGLIILTDSDSAGFVIRGKLGGMLDDDKIKHAYIPDLVGKEKRKSSSSKENKIGVEGMSPEIIIKALELAGATFQGENESKSNKNENTATMQLKESSNIEKPISKTDMYVVGLSGGTNSASRRREFLKEQDLPVGLSANALLDVLNVLFTRESFLALFSEA
ncbi:MAG: DUF4093 domain-containing protein [Oscillospiraceae bacterium]|nr:DUF4093 domain-containing protein [Oscillospiraceae bacterium]